MESCYNSLLRESIFKIVLRIKGKNECKNNIISFIVPSSMGFKIYSKSKNILFLSKLLLLFFSINSLSKFDSPGSIVIDNNNTGLSPRCYYFATLFCFRRWPEFIYLTAQQSRTCARAFHPPKEGESASLSRLKARNSIRVIGEPWLPSRASAIHMNGKSWKKNWREREREIIITCIYIYALSIDSK